MGLEEIGCEHVDWIHLAQDTIQWQAVMNVAVSLRLCKL
jgi:hypothetical protein